MAVQHTHTRVEISCKIIYELLRFEAWLPLALQMRKQYKILCATFIFITFIMRVLWGLKQFCELVLALISSSYLYVFFLYIIFFSGIILFGPVHDLGKLLWSCRIFCIENGMEVALQAGAMCLRCKQNKT